MPYLPLYLTEIGWTTVQIGWLLGLSSVSIMITPVLVTLIADVHFQPRLLIIFINMITGCAFIALWYINDFWLFTLVFMIYSLMAAPLMAVQDGLFFSYCKTHPHEAPAFHKIRVFGTFGFIFSCIPIFVLLNNGAELSAMMLVAATVCFCSAINALALPDVERSAIKSRRLPTHDAFKAIMQKHVLYFSLGLLLMNMVCAAFYSFHPKYLNEIVGLEDKWVGLMVNLGVTVEIVFMLCFGKLLKNLGLRKLLIYGMFTTASRMAIMAYCDSLTMVLLSECLHGMMILVVHVSPPVFLNANAKQSFRSSIQGLFAMCVGGSGRVFGNLIAGYLANISLSILYTYATVLCVLAAGVIFIGLRHWDMHDVHEYDEKNEEHLEIEYSETSSLMAEPE